MRRADAAVNVVVFSQIFIAPAASAIEWARDNSGGRKALEITAGGSGRPKKRKMFVAEHRGIKTFVWGEGEEKKKEEEEAAAAAWPPPAVSALQPTVRIVCDSRTDE